MSKSIELLNCGDGRWIKSDPVLPKDLDDLLAAIEIELPSDYVDFLKICNGGRGALDVFPFWLRLWPAEEILDNRLGYDMEDYIPDFFAIGDSQGGELFAFDIREDPISRVFAIPFIPMDGKHARLVAADFSDLLSHVILDPEARSIRLPERNVE
jgi:hypothetical protein